MSNISFVLNGTSLTAEEGTTILLRVIPENGYELGTLTVTADATFFELDSTAERPPIRTCGPQVKTPIADT